MSPVKSMPLKKWIEAEGGQRAVARKLKVHVSSVCNWGLYNTLPSPKHMVLLVKISGGLLSYKSIIEDFVQANLPETFKSA